MLNEHNEYCANLEAMMPTPRQTPENRLLADVVVHAAVVFCGKENLEILKPFNEILASPANLKAYNNHYSAAYL